MYSTDQVADDTCVVSYRYYSGNKKEILFLFHGFGQSNAVFDSFAASLLTDYSIVSIDLFFHGESHVTSTDVDFISIKRWNALFDLILQKHQIDRFSLLSYSMGSRFIVSLLSVYAHRMDKIVFIAPDGFGNNFWFRVATATAFTRFVFKRSMYNPSWIRAVVGILGAAGIFNSITKRFIERNLESADHRKNIYRTWIYFRKLTIASDVFVQAINKNKIQFLCFCGKEDQMVSKKSMQKICVQTAAGYVELDLTHQKMLQALETTELNHFLISDR